MKKYLIWFLATLIGISSAYAIYQPNLQWWPLVTTYNSTDLTLVQSWTTQSAITIADFLSGYLTNDPYWTWAAPVLTPLQAWVVSFHVWLSSAVTVTWWIAIGNEWATANAFNCLATQGSLCAWYNSISMWDSSQALETGWIAVGYQCIAYTENAVAIWYWAHASWFASFATNANSTTNAPYATAWWFWSHANAEWAVARGLSLTGNSMYWWNIWRRNLWLTNTIFEIGIWTNTTWANAITVYDSGDIQFNTYTTDGFLKTSGATGMLIVDTNTYLTWWALSPYLTIAASWDYFNANSWAFATIAMTGNRNTAYWRGDHSTYWYITTGIINQLTTWYIPFWNWSVFNDSIAFNTGGFIGIGDSAPTQALTVSGNVKAFGTLYKSWSISLPALADTGDSYIGNSGGRLWVFYRSGWVRNVASYLTP